MPNNAPSKDEAKDSKTPADLQNQQSRAATELDDKPQSSLTDHDETAARQQRIRNRPL